MDDDGYGTYDIPITVKVTVTDECIDVDFTGTSDQVKGNINCPISGYPARMSVKVGSAICGKFLWFNSIGCIE